MSTNIFSLVWGSLWVHRLQNLTSRDVQKVEKSYMKNQIIQTKSNLGSFIVYRIVGSICSKPEINLTLYNGKGVCDSSPSISSTCLKIKASLPVVITVSPSCCLFSHSIHACFSSHHPKVNRLLVTSRKVELGDEQKQCYVEAKMSGVLRIIQTWNVITMSLFI